ncbi:MAG: cyanophycinase [Aestuariibacter sp.]
MPVSTTNSTSINLKRLFLSIFLFASTTQLHAQSPDQNYNLLLAGGALKTCSSMSLGSCTGNPFTENAKSHLLYKISPEAIQNFTSSKIFQQQPDETKAKFNALFTHFYAKSSETVTSIRALSELLDQSNSDIGAVEFIRSLPDPIYYALQDFFEIPNPKPEKVNLTANKSNRVKDIYIEFLAQARNKHLQEGKSDDIPVQIGVMTASARDSLSVAEFYQNVFLSAAKLGFPETEFNVKWVPLDISLATVLKEKERGYGSCDSMEQIRASNLSFNRLTIYPEAIQQQQDICSNPQKLTQQISSLSGLFINGGDQNRTRSTLVKDDGSATIWLNIIHKKLHDNHLILGGTSAGTAVQSGGIVKQRPVPMITSGDTLTAMFRGAFALAPPPYGCEKSNDCPYGLFESDLTYNPQGGLGTFSAGILDTHFSERDRQGRLALLAAATKTPLAFGVDEATALLVDTSNNETMNFKVMGEGGVFIVSTKNGIYKSQAQKHQLVGMSHYLTHGDRGQLSLHSGQFEFYFSESKTALTEPLPVISEHRGRWRNEVNTICGKNTFHRWHEDDIAFLVNPSEETAFYTIPENPEAHCSYVNLLFGIEN